MAAGDRPGGPGEQQRGCNGSGQGPCLCPQSSRVGPEAMLTPAVPWADKHPGSVQDTVVRNDPVFSVLHAVPPLFITLSLVESCT